MIIPIGEKVVIRPDVPEDKVGSIYVPELAKHEKNEGTILAIGTGDEHAKELKVGDRVVFMKYAGDDIRYQGEDLKILAESEVLGVIEP